VNDDINVVILAGGKGKRMGSDLPKPLHEVNGKPTIQRIIDAVAPLSAKPIIVIGAHSTSIKDATGNKYEYVLQEEQRGTGHAVLIVKNALGHHHVTGTTMVLPGDHPLIAGETLEALYESHVAAGTKITIGTFTVPDFEGPYACFYHYGRIKRDADGTVQGIVELKDATEDEKNIKEVNISYYCSDTQWLWENIHNLTDANAAKELYLTDMVRLAVETDHRVSTYTVKDYREAMGFNTPEELATLQKLAI